MANKNGEADNKRNGGFFEGNPAGTQVQNADGTSEDDAGKTNGREKVELAISVPAVDSVGDWKENCNNQRDNRA